MTIKKREILATLPQKKKVYKFIRCNLASCFLFLFFFFEICSCIYPYKENRNYETYFVGLITESNIEKPKQPVTYFLTTNLRLLKYFLNEEKKSFLCNNA